MNKSKLLALSAEIALIASTVSYLFCHELWLAIASVVIAAAAVVAAGRIAGAARSTHDGLAVGLGTVVDERQALIEVSSVQGDTFVGRLVRDDQSPDVSVLRPGLVVLVAFDPAAREELSLADEVLAVRASNLVLT